MKKIMFLMILILFPMAVNAKLEANFEVVTNFDSTAIQPDVIHINLEDEIHGNYTIDLYKSENYRTVIENCGDAYSFKAIKGYDDSSKNAYEFDYYINDEDTILIINVSEYKNTNIKEDDSILSNPAVKKMLKISFIISGILLVLFFIIAFIKVLNANK